MKCVKGRVEGVTKMSNFFKFAPGEDGMKNVISVLGRNAGVIMPLIRAVIPLGMIAARVLKKVVNVSVGDVITEVADRVSVEEMEHVVVGSVFPRMGIDHVRVKVERYVMMMECTVVMFY